MFCYCVRCVQVDEATGAVRAMRRLGGDGGAGADDDEGPGRVMLTARAWVVPAPAADAVAAAQLRHLDLAAASGLHHALADAALAALARHL